MSTDKDMKKRKQLVNAIDDLCTQINTIEQYCEELFEEAVDAKKKGCDDIADEHLETIEYFKDFIFDLKKIKKMITSTISNNSDLHENVFDDTTEQDKENKKSVADLKAALVQRVAADGDMPNDALNKAANNTNRFQNK